MNISTLLAESGIVCTPSHYDLTAWDSIALTALVYDSRRANAETAFVCADDEKCKAWGQFQTFAIQNPLADYRAIDIRATGERYAFTIEEYGKVLCRIRLNAIGRCNIYNALAAFAAARSFGFDGESIAQGLASFAAVKRRFEKIGECRGASFICDYAHHPREIISTIATAKGILASGKPTRFATSMALTVLAHAIGFAKPISS